MDGHGLRAHLHRPGLQGVPGHAYGGGTLHAIVSRGMPVRAAGIP